jgi:hypothetical protein
MTAQQRELATLENFRKPACLRLYRCRPRRPADAQRRRGHLELRQHGPVRAGQLEAQQCLQPDAGPALDQQRRAHAPHRQPRGGRSAGGRQCQRRLHTAPPAASAWTTPSRWTATESGAAACGLQLEPGAPERRMQLRGGAGLFQGAAANVWLSNPFSNTGVAVASLSCASYTACSRANNGARCCSPNPGQPAHADGHAAAANVDFLSPGLSSLRSGSQPGLRNRTARCRWWASWWPVPSGCTPSTNTRHLLPAPEPGCRPRRTGSDGPQLFYRAEGYNVNCWNAATATPSPMAPAPRGGQSRTRALSNRQLQQRAPGQGNKRRAGGDAITLSISKPSTGFGWSLAYTKTTAKEVSPLTSSTSGSNWGNRNIFNPNEEVCRTPTT